MLSGLNHGRAVWRNFLIGLLLTLDQTMQVKVEAGARIMGR